VHRPDDPDAIRLGENARQIKIRKLTENVVTVVTFVTPASKTGTRTGVRDNNVVAFVTPPRIRGDNGDKCDNKMRYSSCSEKRAEAILKEVRVSSPR